ncbi:MAG: hypothetical protein E5V72_13785 [Mesorhizobium sp.]|nr:MAG: hypothetical protein E5V72_13785 [Mesorhizobium sp.]
MAGPVAIDTPRVSGGSHWPGSLSAIDENLSSVELGFGVTAGTIHVVFAHVEGDGTLSLVSGQTILAVAGPSSVNSGLSILKPAGGVMGLQRTGSGTWYYTAGAIPNGEAEWFTAAVPTSNTAKTIGPQWKATFTGEIGVKARAAYASANELADIVGSEQVVGWPSLVNTGTNTPSNYSVVMQTPAPSDGYITEVNAGASGSGCHWALASNRPAHWFSRVTQFANVSIADDEPGMTALRPSSTYTPAFYGVTTSGTVSTGTRGPLGESIILADGASLAFTGADEQVDVHHTQDAGQGSLAFAFNGGAAYKTVNAAGALALDQHSGPSPDRAGGERNYTLTVAGGPVEITGLIRLGIKAAGSRPRLRTPRAAHGSYTFASFNAPRLASAVAQCGYAGGKIVPVLALGINDSFGTPPATISTNITSIINTLEAALAPPTRPSSPWDGSYTGGRTYDAALGAIRQTYPVAQCADDPDRRVRLHQLGGLSRRPALQRRRPRRQCIALHRIRRGKGIRPRHSLFSARVK